MSAEKDAWLQLQLYGAIPADEAYSPAKGGKGFYTALLAETRRKNGLPDVTETEPQRPDRLTFEERWHALLTEAATIVTRGWPQMKAVAGLADRASVLGLRGVSARQLEQLLEDAQRQQRPTAAPIEPGGTFRVQPTPWAVEGVFRHALNLLVGQPGAGKSRLAADCIAAWLRGDASWLGRDMPCTLPVADRHALILGADQGLEDWWLTLEPVGLAQRLATGEVQLHPRLTLHPLEAGTRLDADGLAYVRRWSDAHPGGVVIGDALAALLPPGIDEDKPAAARPIHALQEAMGTCWSVLTHHSRKGAGREGNLGVGAGRGSSAIDGAVSRVIGLGLIHRMENNVLTAQESDPRRELLSTKRGGATLHLVISSDANGHWTNEGNAADMKREERLERTLANLTDAQTAALAALEDATDWLTGRQVAEALLEPGEAYEARGAHAASCRKVLKRLESLGLIETQRVGLDRLYRVAGGADSPPNPSRGSEIELTGSNGSKPAAQGISPAHTLAHTGSHRLSPSPAALEPVRATPEPLGEPPKPVAAQRVSHSSHPPGSPHGSPTGSPSDSLPLAQSSLPLGPVPAPSLPVRAVPDDDADDPHWGPPRTA